MQIRDSISGFTLIELSIVLVIIGLIVGGILTGQDLINAASIRAQISQIEKYQTAVRTFQNKYGNLPGDIPNPQATNFGFKSRGAYAGEGDGNGIIEGNCPDNAAGDNDGFYAGCGELAMFWVDLSTAALINSTIKASGAGYPIITTNHSTITMTSTPPISSWLPPASLGTSNFVYLFSFNGTNYFAVSTVTQIGYTIASTVNPGVTIQQAYNIDSKIDDGLPQSGSVTTCYANDALADHQTAWVAAGTQGAGGANCAPVTTATPYANTNCYDNNGTAGTQIYSINKNANLQNCALSFRFQ